MKTAKRKLENDFNELMKSADTFPRFIEQSRAFIHKYDEMVIWASIDFQRDTSNQKYEDRLKEVRRDIKPLLATCKKRLYDICLEKHGEAIENTRKQTILMHQQTSFSDKNILICQQEDEQINRYIQLIGSLQSMDEEAVLIHDLTALLFKSDEDVRETA